MARKQLGGNITARASPEPCCLVIYLSDCPITSPPKVTRMVAFEKVIVALALGNPVVMARDTTRETSTCLVSTAASSCCSDEYRFVRSESGYVTMMPKS